MGSDADVGLDFPAQDYDPEFARGLDAQINDLAERKQVVERLVQLLPPNRRPRPKRVRAVSDEEAKKLQRWESAHGDVIRGADGRPTRLGRRLLAEKARIKLHQRLLDPNDPEQAPAFAELQAQREAIRDRLHKVHLEWKAWRDAGKPDIAAEKTQTAGGAQ
jgi:hypothetical protein